MRLALVAVGLLLAGCASNLPKAEGVVTPVTLTAEQTAAVEKGLRDAIKDPASAQFGAFRAGRNGAGRINVCGTINAKNSYGGYAGHMPFVGSFIGTTNAFGVLSIASTQEFSTDIVRMQCQMFGI